MSILRSFGVLKTVSASLIFVCVTGCSTSQVAANKALDNSVAAQTPIDKSVLQAELNSLNAQIAGLEAMATDAEARAQSYQAMNAGSEGMIFGAQAEASSYRAQISQLLMARSQIQTQLQTIQ